MSRQDDYQRVLAARPTLADVAAKVREQRDIVDKRLTWARLRYAYADYNHFVLFKMIVGDGKMGDLVVDEQTKLRYGWVRWQEIRARIDSVDSWLKNPSEGNSQAILHDVMVGIPNSIDKELAVWERNKTLAKDTVIDAAKNAASVAGSAVAGIALPIALVLAAGSAYNWSKKR